MLYVFGHQNPDTDAISSAIVFASFLNKQNIEAKAFRLGEVNFETPFVLKKANLDLPEILVNLPANTKVALIDHNESSQSVTNLKDLDIKFVIDHHKLGDLETASPAYLRFEPLGSCGSILYKMYKEQNLDISQSEAILMLSSILSDTLHFRSPTTTEFDKKAVEDLAKIAQINNISDYAMEMFAAKSDLGDTSAEKILKMDYKEFVFGEQNWGIGVVETTNPKYILNREEEIKSAMQELKQNKNLYGILLSVVDILEEKNITFVISKIEEDLIFNVFDVKTLDGRADLGARISRKKQIIPQIEKYFND